MIKRNAGSSTTAHLPTTMWPSQKQAIRRFPLQDHYGGIHQKPGEKALSTSKHNNAGDPVFDS
jgi:hypothetical protein